MSNFLRLNLKDVAKGLSVAVIAVVLGALQQAVTAYGFDVASYDWSGILDLAWKTAGVYLTKNLISDNEGRVLGVVG
jgi:hypothetical protein